MKQLLIALLLTGLSIAQEFNRGSGIWLSDSLWNDIYVRDTVVTISTATEDTTYWIDTIAAQTYVEIPLSYDYDWATITAIDSGDTYTDSCIVEFGAFKYELDETKRVKTFIPIDTVWQRVHFMRDSSWTNTNLIPDNSSTKSYTLFVGNYEVIRVRMTNTEAVENRIWRFLFQASRKK